MKRKVINNNGRRKAFIGAVVGAVGGLVGGLIGKRKQKKAQERAYRQAQIEQTKNEGFQQAQAMSAQYANQDYVDEYRNKITLKNGGKVNMKKKTNDRIAVAKKFKCGGRKQANFGKNIVNDFKSIGQEFNSDNLSNTIAAGIGGIGKALGVNGSTSISPQMITTKDATTINNIQRNKKIAQIADQRKQQQLTTAAKYGTRNKCACGSRKKALFGIGAMIDGVGSIIGGATQSTRPQKQVKTSNGFAYNAPKIGMEKNSYQVDSNGNPINATNANTNIITDNVYNDRLVQAKFGMRKRAKCGG